MNAKNQQDVGSVGRLVDHLFRTEAGKIISLLTGIFGLKQMHWAEDIVQETLIDALNQWSMGDIPDNPSGWLLQVAKFKTINYLKRDQVAKSHIKNSQNTVVEEGSWDQIFQENAIEDNQLRMIFACCHPELPIESQIALTLKTLCGLSVPEIARALVTTTANVNKRLYRAKQKFRSDEIVFELPVNEELSQRLDAVYLTLYLLFNEGYHASHHDNLIREDLCLDAMRFVALITEHYDQEPKGWALLALMHLHAARFEARLDARGGIIIFADQDREKWDREMIRWGIYYLQRASTGDELSAYHLEAGIAAEHCMSESYEATNWRSIYKQYEILYVIKPNPIIALNLAIISSRLEGLESSIGKLHALEEKNALKNYYLLDATLGHFYLEIKQYDTALTYLRKALKQTNAPAERQLLLAKIRSCSAM